MWKWLARRHLERAGARKGPILEEEIVNANSVLFAVFARYGDGVIAFKLIREFVKHYPDKRYWLLTTPQALPYAQALLAGVGIEIAGFNKRTSWLTIVRTLVRLRRHPPDIGFNPWSHGAESTALVGFARRFHPYREFARFPRNHNLYDRARRYLGLQCKPGASSTQFPRQAERIVICPFSTDVRKGLDHADLEKLIQSLRSRYAGTDITVAGLAGELQVADGLDVNRFVLNKTTASSRAFLTLLRRCGLFVGVDAGPLHLADALGVPAIGVFGPTAPETILDHDTSIVALRAAAMRGFFCDVTNCHNPVCLHDLLADPGFSQVQVDYAAPVALETKVCRARPAS